MLRRPGRDPHPSRQVVHPRPLRRRRPSGPAPRHGAGVGRQARFYGRGRHRPRRGHHREVHPHGATRMRTHVEVDIPRSGCAARRREGADRPLPLGDRSGDLRHAAGGLDQQSRHRRADGGRAEDRRHRGRRRAQLRHRPARPDPPRLRDGAEFDVDIDMHSTAAPRPTSSTPCWSAISPRSTAGAGASPSGT